MTHVIEKSTDGYAPTLRATKSPSPTTTNMTVGDSDAVNPRAAAVAYTPAIQSAGRRAESPTAELSGGMACGSQAVVGAIKPTDFRTIEGSYAGDHRFNPGDVATGAVNKAAGKGPREGMGQTPISGRTPTAGDFRSFPGDLADSEVGN
jgi:hypothetical protein